MMRKYLLLCLVLIASICAFSQNTSTVTITSEQLKTTNLIFAEHQKLSETVPLLKSQITNLELINKSWEKTDSVRRVQLLYYGNIIEDKNRSIENRDLIYQGEMYSFLLDNIVIPNGILSIFIELIISILSGNKA